MPKNKWSAKDERKYEHIYEACVIQARGKKGAKKHCKKVAAATVSRDLARGLGGLSGPGACRFVVITKTHGIADGQLASEPVSRSGWSRAARMARPHNYGESREVRLDCGGSSIVLGQCINPDECDMAGQYDKGDVVLAGNRLERAIESVGPMDGWPDNALATNQWAPVPMRWFRSKAAAEKWIAENTGDGRPKRAQNVIPPGWGMDGPKWAVYAQQFRGLGAITRESYNNYLLNELARFADDKATRRAHPGEAEAWYRDHPREMREVIRKEIAERKRKGLMGLRGPRRAPASYAVWNAATHKWRRFEKREDAAAFARQKGETVEPLYRYKVHSRSRFDDPGEVNGPRTYVAFNPEHAEEKFYESFLDPSEAESHEVTKVELAGLRGTSAEHAEMGDALLRVAERSYDLGHYRGAYNAGMRAMQEGQWVKEPWEAKARITNGALDITERAGPREWRKQKGLGAREINSSLYRIEVGDPVRTTRRGERRVKARVYPALDWAVPFDLDYELPYDAKRLRSDLSKAEGGNFQKVLSEHGLDEYGRDRYGEMGDSFFGLKGLGAQALSLRLGGLRGPWQNLRSVDPNAEPGVFKKKGDAYAIITDGEDGDVELAFYHGRDMGTLKQEDFEIHDTFDAADRAAKRRGFDGLRGTPTQHAQQARMLMSEASSWGAQEGPLTEMEYAARASEEAAWSGDPDLERKADRFFAAAERGAKRRMG